jgi:hypothetical protein
MGRMSDRQIMRNLGLRESDYRELRALALVARAAPPRWGERGHDRSFPHRRAAASQSEADSVIEVLLELTGLTREQLMAAQGDAGIALRDLLAWLLRFVARKSPASIGRLLGMTEYSARLASRRYDALVLTQAESPYHSAWRQEICARLGVK